MLTAKPSSLYFSLSLKKKSGQKGELVLTTIYNQEAQMETLRGAGKN